MRWCRALCFLATGLGLLLCGCKLGPDYQRPEVVVPEQYRWKAAEPADHLPKGEWWALFRDDGLNELERLAAEQNQDLRAAAARVEQARAVARMSRADLFPVVNSHFEFTRYRTSGGRPSPVPFPIPSMQQSQWTVPFDLSYEVDLWGKVRRSFEAARHLAFGAEAARQNALLSLQADVAMNYFSRVGAAAEARTLEQTIAIREEALALFEQRLRAGVGTEFEVERTKVEVATARADLAMVRRRQAELENALAVLCGQAPGGFAFNLATNLPAVPEVGADLPASLLERRPDVAEAERQLAARCAQIGVAKAAFFPALRLTAGAGFQSGDLSDLFYWESRFWQLSPSLSLPVFQGGRLRSDLARARAAYDEAMAIYRQRLLVAFRDVDDSLAALRFLREQYGERQQAALAARNSARIAFDRFRAGAVNFLEVVDAESARLLNELIHIRIGTEQMVATVRLIKALGGGWEPGS